MHPRAVEVRRVDGVDFMALPRERRKPDATGQLDILTPVLVNTRRFTQIQRSLLAREHGEIVTGRIVLPLRPLHRRRTHCAS